MDAVYLADQSNLKRSSKPGHAAERLDQSNVVSILSASAILPVKSGIILVLNETPALSKYSPNIPTVVSASSPWQSGVISPLIEASPFR